MKKLYFKIKSKYLHDFGKCFLGKSSVFGSVSFLLSLFHFVIIETIGSQWYFNSEVCVHWCLNTKLSAIL